jgi:hypothetical protein
VPAKGEDSGDHTPEVEEHCQTSWVGMVYSRGIVKMYRSFVVESDSPGKSHTTIFSGNILVQLEINFIYSKIKCSFT